ncbi:MAG TPA: DNA polymerase III subunit beta [Candidatus Binatia bacterium]|jgi:DNA polymerase-3 subunit beta|nr:DNA polymerase III subunit beta [Candidatus Binatia bacterium]
MKLQVTQENLNRALSNVARVASGRNTLPILSNILIKTANNRLTIAATNLDIAITNYIGSKVSEEGAITVPARLMQEFVSSLPPGVIDIKLDDYKLAIKTDQYQSVINGVSAEEYPVMPAITKGQKFNLPASLLKKALTQVIFAAATDESRPVLTGVYIYTGDGQLSMVATDSYRLSKKVLNKSNQAVKLLVPASALQDLLRIVSDDDAEVSVTHDDQQVLFKVGEVELVARLIEGNYPDVSKLIPKEFAVTATVKRSELLNITKVSSLFARESAGSITLEVDEETKALSIRSIASQLGENTASTSGKISGSGSITLNSRYLLDGLHALTGDEVTFSFNGKLEPSLLKDPADPSYTHIIMPLKS